MMKLKTVTIRMGETIPTAQFANVRPEIEVSVELSEGDTVEGAIGYARGLAKVAFDELRDEMMGIKPKPQTTGFVRPVAPLQNAPQQPAGVWPIQPQLPPQPPLGQPPAPPATATSGIPKVDPVTF